MASSKTKKLLSVFMRRLTNLSANNRSLFLPRIYTDQYIDVHSLSQLNGENAFSLIEALMAQKKKIICPIVDTRMEEVNIASGKLKKLKRISEFLFEERGSYDLHVAWPFVHGKFADGTTVRAPLAFFPVSIESDHTHWILSPKEESEATINKSFLLAYSFYNNTKLDEALMEETLEDFPPDPTAFRTELYKIFQSGKIDINFNPAHYYQNELTSFKSFTKEKFNDSYELGELKLIPEAVLGIFPQAGSTLVPDYLHLLEEDSFQDLEDFFVRTESAHQGVTNFIPLVKEEKVYSIFPTDSWQENALKAVKLGHSMVVEGPPGTGKSQLICNLVSDSIANGKRVLVVSQKRAALDVVYSRLAEKKLDEFVTLVHDYKNDRKIIFEKLARQINRVDEYKSRNISLDAIQLDRSFFKASKQIDQLTEELEDFRTMLFDEADCGTSIKQLYLQSDPQLPSVSLRQEYPHFKFHELDIFLRKLKRYVQLASALELPGHPWSKRKSFASLTPGHLKTIHTAVIDIAEQTRIAINYSKKNFGASSDWEDIASLLEKKAELQDIRYTIRNKNSFESFKAMLTTPEQELSALWLSNVERMINDCFADGGPESSVTAAQLGVFQKALHRSMKARRSLWGLLRWQLFSKDKVLITRALVANNLNSDKHGFQQLERKLDNRLNLEHNLSKLKAIPWVLNIPEEIDQAKIKDWFADQQLVLKARLAYSSIRALKNFIDPFKVDFESFYSSVQLMAAWLDNLQDKVTDWHTYFTPGQIHSLSMTVDLKDNLIQSLREDFDKLCEFDALKENLSTEEKAVIEKIADLTNRWQANEFENIFLNSLSLAWIDHIEQKHPELRMASSGKINAIEEDLQQQMDVKENVCAEIMLLRAREVITDNLEFNRLNNRISYRDLLHQVTKKKKIWPLRKVIAEFEEEIFKLTPCWLASPESVSALFAMREVFDLVIFDEASQCFAERGIPALYRGKQSVVAGDSKQLRPGDFFVGRWQEEDWEEADAEVDSLLELAGRYLMKVQLNGHYRSKRWELIQFSNKNFYDHRLELLPDFDSIQDPSPAIEYVKVDGWWEHHCNETEAVEVLSQIKKIWLEHSEKKIGVVTFNIVQQSLILDLLDKEPELSKHSADDLFVKNIENVQGDERDVIIFSIGYAADKKGKLNVQFGSLSQDGGENRLNVAVTRAREKVIVVTSILPHQLHVEESKHRGPKLLKDYLTYAAEVAEGKWTQPNNVSDQSQAKTLKNLVAKTDAQEYAFSDEYPFADAVVLKQGKPAAILLTDDNLYFQSLSSKALHAQIPQLLDKKKWPHTRVYSRNFWMDKKRFFKDIEISL